MGKTEKTEYLEEIKRLEKKLVDLKTESIRIVNNMPKPFSFSFTDEKQISDYSDEALGIALRNLDELSDNYERNRVLKENILDRCEYIEKEPLQYQLPDLG